MARWRADKHTLYTTNLFDFLFGKNVQIKDDSTYDMS